MNSAKIAGPDADRQSMALISSREGAKAMLVAVTTQGDLKTLSGSSWKKLTKEDLVMPGVYQYNSLFTAKDDELLCGLYQKLHGASQADVDAIASKSEAVEYEG